MRATPLVVVGVLTVGSLLTASAAGSGVRRPMMVTRAGITTTLPDGWQVMDRRLTPCTDPFERLTVVGRGAMVMLQERLSVGRGFAPRPRQFSLRGTAQSMECCAPLKRAGWFLAFRDRGRGFYSYVYLGGRGTRAEALAVLDSLRIRPSAG